MVFRFGDPNLNLHVPRLHPGARGHPQINWLVLIDEQMSFLDGHFPDPKWRANEQMSNWVGVKHLPANFFEGNCFFDKKIGWFTMMA